MHNARKIRVPTWLRCAGAAVFMGFCPLVFAAEEAVSVSKDGMKTIETSFEVKRWSIGNPSIVRIESVGPRKVRVIGLMEGSTAVQVTGENDSMAEYDVTVIPDIANALTSLRRLLEDEVPGVEASMDAASGKIRLEGEVFSPDQWDYLGKVIAQYPSQVMNLVKFNLAPEAKQRLLDAFENVGIQVVENEKGKAAPDGAIALKTLRNGLYLSGTVLNKGQLEKIRQILAAHQWMIAEPGTDPGKEGKIMAIIDVGLDSTPIELGVAFLTMAENDFIAREGNLLEGGLMTVNNASMALQGEYGKDVHDTSTFGGSYLVASGLNGTLRWFGEKGTNRTRRAGHFTLRNNGARSKFKEGGTILKEVSGEVGGSVVEIPYGLELAAEAFLKDRETADLTFDVSATITQFNRDGQYEKFGPELQNQQVTCKLGHTLVIAGAKYTAETAATRGVPILRNIPVLNWFFSGKVASRVDMRMLVLISPFLAENEEPDSPVSAETRGLRDDMSTPIGH